VTVTASVASGDGARHEVGPGSLQFSGSITNEAISGMGFGESPDAFGPRRPVLPDAPLVLTRTYPDTGARPLRAGETLSLDVRMQAFDASGHRVARDLRPRGGPGAATRSRASARRRRDESLKKRINPSRSAPKGPCGPAAPSRPIPNCRREGRR
jgi:hypothetical protein